MSTRNFYYLMFLLLSLYCYQQTAMANYLNKQQLIQSVLSEMVFIPGGSFMMGTNNPKYIDLTGDNTPAHRVILSSFYFSKYLTSANQINSYYVIKHQQNKLPNPRLFEEYGQYPACPNWQTANNYCHWLAQQTGLPFALSTEAQWEYTARDGGKNIAYATDNGKIEPGINFPTEKSFIYRLKHPNALGQMIGIEFLNVDEIPVNKLGIHQMGGNVSEWVKDWYSPVYYQHSPLHNPQGPNQAQAKIQNGSQLGQFGLYAANDHELMRVTRGINSGSMIGPPKIWAVTTNNYARDSLVPISTAGFRCVINSDLPLQQLKQIAARQLAKNQKELKH